MEGGLFIYRFALLEKEFHVDGVSNIQNNGYIMMELLWDYK